MGPVAFILSSTLTMVCIISLMLVALVDPGIITVDNNVPKYSSSSNKKNELGRCRWCDTCNIMQPSHAVHCPDCNLCIAQYDHHCPWVGTCVGRNNIRAFVIFNCSWISYLIFGLVYLVLYKGENYRIFLADDDEIVV